MIAYIEGTVIDRPTEEELIVLVHGIGYSVAVPSSIGTAVELGEKVTLHTHHHIREELMDLYGFADRAALGLFRKLISVKGVGPRIGLAMLSSYTVEQLQQAIIAADSALLSSVSGVGKKTAERIVLDLKDAIAALPVGDSSAGAAGGTGGAGPSVVDALVGLGYSQMEAVAAVQGIDTTGTLEEQIRQALQRQQS